MSLALYNTGGLRFWREDDIKMRTYIVGAIVECMKVHMDRELAEPDWSFERVDTPVIMPRDLVSASYDDNDVFTLEGVIGDKRMALRAETTLGSYLVAQHLMQTGTIRAPLCVWTVGQSFRRETNDGASPSKLRFNAFYQLEFQCVFSPLKNTNPAEHVREQLRGLVAELTGLPTRLVPSDRLPAYSEETIDIEVEWTRPNASKPEWKEVASTSIRTDFPTVPGHKPYTVFEVAFGVDRMVAVSKGEV